MRLILETWRYSKDSFIMRYQSMCIPPHPPTWIKREANHSRYIEEHDQEFTRPVMSHNLYNCHVSGNMDERFGGKCAETSNQEINGWPNGQMDRWGYSHVPFKSTDDNIRRLIHSIKTYFSNHTSNFITLLVYKQTILMLSIWYIFKYYPC